MPSKKVFLDLLLSKMALTDVSVIISCRILIGLSVDAICVAASTNNMSRQAHIYSVFP